MSSITGSEEESFTILNLLKEKNVLYLSIGVTVFALLTACFISVVVSVVVLLSFGAGLLLPYFIFREGKHLPNLLVIFLGSEGDVDGQQNKAGELRRSCSVCGGEQCSRQGPDVKVGLASLAQQGPHHPHIHVTTPKCLDHAIEELLTLVLDEHVYSWYRELSVHDQLADEIRHVIRYAVCVLYARLQQVDLCRVIVDRLLPSVFAHLDQYVEGGRRVRGVSGLEAGVLEYCRRAGWQHPVMSSREAEAQYLRSLVSSMKLFLLPNKYRTSSVADSFLRELLGRFLLLQAMDLLSEPDTVNTIVLLLLDPDFLTRQSEKLKQEQQQRPPQSPKLPPSSLNQNILSGDNLSSPLLSDPIASALAADEESSIASSIASGFSGYEAAVADGRDGVVDCSSCPVTGSLGGSSEGVIGDAASNNDTHNKHGLDLEPVLLLKNFASVNTHPRNSLVRNNLSAVLKDQTLLYLFHTFLKEEQAINILQFCLTVEDFNRHILDPELSGAAVQAVHVEALDLYHTYMSPGAADRLPFPVDVVTQIRDMVHSEASAIVKLRTTRPLFQAYEHAYNLLEREYLPAFMNSHMYFAHLCGSRSSQAYHKTSNSCSPSPRPARKSSSFRKSRTSPTSSAGSSVKFSSAVKPSTIAIGRVDFVSSKTAPIGVENSVDIRTSSVSKGHRKSFSTCDGINFQRQAAVSSQTSLTDIGRSASCEMIADTTINPSTSSVGDNSTEASVTSVSKTDHMSAIRAIASYSTTDIEDWECAGYTVKYSSNNNNINSMRDRFLARLRIDGGTGKLQDARITVSDSSSVDGIPAPNRGLTKPEISRAASASPTPLASCAGNRSHDSMRASHSDETIGCSATASLPLNEKQSAGSATNISSGSNSSKVSFANVNSMNSSSNSLSTNNSATISPTISSVPLVPPTTIIGSTSNFPGDVNINDGTMNVEGVKQQVVRRVESVGRSLKTLGAHMVFRPQVVAGDEDPDLLGDSAAMQYLHSAAAAVGEMGGAFERMSSVVDHSDAASELPVGGSILPPKRGAGGETATSGNYGEQEDTQETTGIMVQDDGGSSPRVSRGGLEGLTSGSYRDLSAWRVSIPRLDYVPDPSCAHNMTHFFVIDVTRIDVNADSTSEDTHWEVLRRFHEFYILESKLTEFHGEFHYNTLPSRRSLFTSTHASDFMATRRQIFEEYLQKLLQTPALRKSQLLFLFLKSRDEFTSSFLPDVSLGRLLRDVPRKLVKERGQHLEPFISLMMQAAQPPQSTEPLEEAREASEALQPPELYPLQSPVYGDNAASLCPPPPHALPQPPPPVPFTTPGITEMILYVCVRVYGCALPAVRWLVAARALLAATLDAALAWLLRRVLHQRLLQPSVAVQIVHLIRDALLEGGGGREAGARQRELAVRAAVVGLLPQWLTRSLLNDDTYREGANTIVNMVQHPLLNKQLSYVLLDQVLEELFPELTDKSTAAAPATTVEQRDSSALHHLYH